MLCLAAATSAPYVFAQSAAPNPPETGANFVKLASQDGMTEVQLARLALTKSSNPDIKSFATRMVHDHSKANRQLVAIAKKDGIPVSHHLDAEHAAMLKEMRDKSAAEFDTAYTQDMVTDHEKAIALFKHEETDSDSDLASFAKATLPVLLEHQKLAQQLTEKTAQNL